MTPRFEPIPLVNRQHLYAVWDNKRGKNVRLSWLGGAAWWPSRERAQEAADVLNHEYEDRRQ